LVLAIDRAANIDRDGDNAGFARGGLEGRLVEGGGGHFEVGGHSNAPDLAEVVPEVVEVVIIRDFVDLSNRTCMGVEAIVATTTRKHLIDGEFEGVILIVSIFSVPIMRGSSARSRAELSSRQGLMLISMSHTLNCSSMMKS
jgi:hypothetical protein